MEIVIDGVLFSNRSFNSELIMLDFSIAAKCIRNILRSFHFHHPNQWDEESSTISLACLYGIPDIRIKLPFATDANTLSWKVERKAICACPLSIRKRCIRLQC